MEQYLRSIIKDNVISKFRNMYSHWTDSEVEEEVDKELHFFLDHLYESYKKKDSL